MNTLCLYFSSLTLGGWGFRSHLKVIFFLLEPEESDSEAYDLTRRYHMSRWFHNILSHAFTILFMLHSKHLLRKLLPWTEGRLLRIFLFHNFLCSHRVQRSLWELRSTTHSTRRCSMSVYPSLHQLAQYVFTPMWHGMGSVRNEHLWMVRDSFFIRLGWVKGAFVSLTDTCLTFDCRNWVGEYEFWNWTKKAVCLPGKDVAFLLHSGNYGIDRTANRRSWKLVMSARQFVLELSCAVCLGLLQINDKSWPCKATLLNPASEFRVIPSHLKDWRVKSKCLAFYEFISDVINLRWDEDAYIDHERRPYHPQENGRSEPRDLLADFLCELEACCSDEHFCLVLHSRKD